jgi:hypothetical protein
VSMKLSLGPMLCYPTYVHRLPPSLSQRRSWCSRGLSGARCMTHIGGQTYMTRPWYTPLYSDLPGNGRSPRGDAEAGHCPCGDWLTSSHEAGHGFAPC